MIQDILDVYLTDKVPHMRTAKNISYNISNLNKWWARKRASQINPRECRAYAGTKSASGAGADIKVLRGAVNHWHSEYGPLAVIPKFWRPAEPPARERWLTKSEAARLLRAARKWPYLARIILLGLYTGSRGGVIKSLRWEWIDFEAGVMRRRGLNETDSGNKRRPPVKLGRRILVHLRRWKRLDGGKCDLVVNFNGKKIDDPHGSWRKAIAKAKLPGVTLHTLRHTRATWMMKAGVDPWQAAGFLGMSVRVLEQVYGHHHPTFQSDAADI